MVRNRSCSTRRKIVCMCRRAFWPGVSRRWGSVAQFVMSGLDPGIHVLNEQTSKTWMAGTSPAMTERAPFHFAAADPRYSAMTSQSPGMKSLDTPIRAPSPVPVDDAVLPFEVAALDLRGRLTRMGPALDDILTKHDYPAPVGKLLGEAIVLTTLLGSSLKFEGRFILDRKSVV